MKKLIAILATLSVIVGGTLVTSAGDREWATAGKILTGVVAGTVITRAIEPSWFIPPRSACGWRRSWLMPRRYSVSASAIFIGRTIGSAGKQSRGGTEQQPARTKVRRVFYWQSFLFLV